MKQAASRANPEDGGNTKLCGITSQKAKLFRNIAVRTSNPISGYHVPDII
jgi:hypothetical protein